MVTMDTMAFAVLNFTGSVAEDALPLRVQSPSFILASFRQSTTYPGRKKLGLEFKIVAALFGIKSRKKLTCDQDFAMWPFCETITRH